MKADKPMSEAPTSLRASQAGLTLARGFAAAACALLWCAIAVLALTGRSRVGPIEALFLFAPLVHVQLGFRVVRGLIGEYSRLGRVAHSLLPLAAILAAASFWPPHGPLAGDLALTWPLVCGLAGLDGFWRLARQTSRTVEGAFMAAAFFYLVVGGVWLVLSRLGVTPMHLPGQIVLLASVHFHFTGFALPVFAAATRRASRLSSPPAYARLGRVVFLFLAAGIICGPLFLAAGNLLMLPILKLAGALLLTLMSFGLVGMLIPVLPAVRSRPARALLGVATISLVGGMTLVGVYTVGEFTGRYWLLIPEMTRFHGTVNALGFVLCGLLGWTFVLESGDSPR
jgi:hypothetical protein